MLAACAQNNQLGIDRETQAPADLGSDQVLSNTEVLPAVLNFSAGDCEGTLAQANARFQQVQTAASQIPQHQSAPQALSFLKLLNQLDMELQQGYTKALLQSNVHPDDTVRKQAELCQQDFSNLNSDKLLSRPIFDRLVAMDGRQLDKGAQKYLTQLIRDLKRAGVHKEASVREEIKLLNEEITQLGQDFSRNIRQDIRRLEIDSAQRLVGLPQDYIDAHPPNENGKIVITTDYPDFFPIARYAEDDLLRQQMYRLFRDRGYPDNEAVLRKLLKARWRLAKLLGYSDYADFITEDKMIGSAENAQQFIDQITSIAAPRAEQDYQLLLQRLQQQIPAATKVQAWQKGYYSELIRKEQYHIDSKEIRQYFNYPEVERGIFELVEEMFSVDIRPWQTPVWHSSVKAFQVFEQGQLIGQFFIDMHPRENKYKHAAHFPLISGIKGKQIPTATLVCNFPGAGAAGGLMEHGQVTTFLHEFGHLLHHIFAGKQQWLMFSGVRTERDFVEAPSQMLEEWVWDGPTLQRFARNKKGEVIPMELVAKMKQARLFGEGLDIRTQMFYAALSLSYYRQDPHRLDLTAEMNRLQRQYSLFEPMEDTHFYANFGHLYGYSAMYYTYMWSLVIALDMFSEFEKHGLLNVDVASRYREAVLAPGGSDKAEDLVRQFLGRPYSYDAFNKRVNGS